MATTVAQVRDVLPRPYSLTAYSLNPLPSAPHSGYNHPPTPNLPKDQYHGKDRP
jgi:hypothetical protein